MEFDVKDLGLIDYKSAENIQKEIVFRIKSKEAKSTLLTCRHKPVITLGRCSHRQNIVVTDETLREKAISVFAAGRGGDVTYHGPGQLTVYPVFDLNRYRRDIHFFLRQLEGVVICSLERLGVRSERLPGLTGVWVDGKKISSIGIAVRSWISFHGLTVNVKNDDLDNFRLIRPCGLDVEMTSLESCLGKTVEINSVKQGFIESFRGAFAG